MAGKPKAKLGKKGRIFFIAFFIVMIFGCGWATLTSSMFHPAQNNNSQIVTATKASCVQLVNTKVPTPHGTVEVLDKSSCDGQIHVRFTDADGAHEKTVPNETQWIVWKNLSENGVSLNLFVPFVKNKGFVLDCGGKTYEFEAVTITKGSDFCGNWVAK